MKEFEVDVSYDALVSFSTTIKVKAKNKKEAEEQFLKNMFEGKNFMNRANWDESIDQPEQPVVEDVREV